MTTPVELRELIDLAERSAREAANVVFTGFRTAPEAARKSPRDLVTSFDHASEDILRSSLGRETGYAVVGEERGATAARDAKWGLERAWHVDPIDGTTNFVHGHPFFCVSVGLVERGEAILGVIVAPALDCVWQAGVGIGAWRNGAAMHVSSRRELGDSLLATGFSASDASSAERNMERTARIRRHCRALRRCGAAALDLALVADGTYEGYWEDALHSWDIAAGIALVRAAGGQATRFDGSALELASGEVLATCTTEVHGALRALLEP